MDVDRMRLALAVAGGELRDLEQLRLTASQAFLVVAADGGARHLFAAEVPPNAVVGDLDSIGDDVLEWCKGRGAEIHAYPPEKDDTDLQLALAFCLVRGATSIVVAGALGGRIDHTLGNIALLESMGDLGAPCTLVDGSTEVRLVGRCATFVGSPGDILSLIPLDRAVTGVTTRGLRYGLNAGILTRGGTPSGVSNEFIGREVRVEAEGGVLLAVHTRLSNV